MVWQETLEPLVWPSTWCTGDRAELRHAHTFITASLNNLGMLLHNRGGLAVAKVYLEQALVLLRQALGEAQPKTADSLSSLGMLLYATGDLSATRPYLERALVILEDNPGRNHPNVGTVGRYL